MLGQHRLATQAGKTVGLEFDAHLQLVSGEDLRPAVLGTGRVVRRSGGDRRR
jgi:hypothetical protein